VYVSLKEALQMDTIQLRLESENAIKSIADFQNYIISSHRAYKKSPRTQYVQLGNVHMNKFKVGDYSGLVGVKKKDGKIVSGHLIGHLSQFNNIDEFLGWSSYVLKEQKDAIWDAKVERLDFCTDIKMPFETIYESAFRPRISCTKLYESKEGSFSFYFGKQKEIYCYQRIAHREMTDDLGALMEKGEKYIRFEARGFFNEYKKGDSFKHLVEIDGINPFKLMHFTKLDQAIVQELDRKKATVIKAYLYDVERFGLANAEIQNRKFSWIKKAVKNFLVPFSPPPFEVAINNRLNKFWDRQQSLFKE